MTPLEISVEHFQIVTHLPHLLRIDLWRLRLAVVQSEHQRPQLLKVLLKFPDRLHVGEEGGGLERALVVRQPGDPGDVLIKSREKERVASVEAMHRR